MTGHPLGHVREAVLSLPKYDLKILLNGYPAHSARCRRASAQRDRIRQPDYDPSDRVRNERLDVACDCGTDRRYICYLEDQLQALRAALTPSTETKAAYMGEFRFDVPFMDEEGEETEVFIDTPWDTIKQIMAAIRARAALGGPQ